MPKRLRHVSVEERKRIQIWGICQLWMASEDWPSSLVLIVHLTFSSQAQTSSSLINAIIVFTRFGWVGVYLFFVLSGFLITGILFESLGQKSYFVRFYARRFLRIRWEEHTSELQSL